MTKKEYLAQVKLLNAQIAELRNAYRKTAFKTAAKEFPGGHRTIEQLARRHALPPNELGDYLDKCGLIAEQEKKQAESYEALDRVAREFKANPSGE